MATARSSLSDMVLPPHVETMAQVMSKTLNPSWKSRRALHNPYVDDMAKEGNENDIMDVCRPNSNQS